MCPPGSQCHGTRSAATTTKAIPATAVTTRLSRTLGATLGVMSSACHAAGQVPEVCAPPLDEGILRGPEDRPEAHRDRLTGTHRSVEAHQPVLAVLGGDETGRQPGLFVRRPQAAGRG